MIHTDLLRWDLRRYGLLEGLSLSVAAGEAVGLLGPLDSGHSTAIKLLAGLMPPTGGHAQICKLDLHSDEARRRVGYLPFPTGLFEDLRVGEVINFLARCARVEPAAWNDRRRRLLELTDLQAHEDEEADKLDREHKQLLALAGALVNDPAVLLLDQPAAGLDLAARLRMRKLLVELRPGRTLLVASNILTDLVGLCDRIGLMEHGRLIALEPAAEIARRLGGRLIELELAEPAVPSLAAIRAHPDVIEADADAHFLIINLNGGVTDPLAVIATIARRTGLTVLRAREHQAAWDQA